MMAARPQQQKKTQKRTLRLAALVAALLAVVVVVVAAVVALRGGGSRPPASYVLSPEEAEAHDTLRGLLEKVGGVLRRHHIPYWPMGGTLLGAVRHQGFIPWDHDIDLGIWARDLPRAAEAIQTELAGQARWWRGLRCFKVSPPHRHDTVIDIFPMRFRASPKGRILSFASQLARESWPREYFTEEEFGLGQKPLPFEGIGLRGPDTPCPYLDRAYPGWDARGYDDMGGAAAPSTLLRRLGAAIAPSTTYVFTAAESRRLCGAAEGR